MMRFIKYILEKWKLWLEYYTRTLIISWLNTRGTMGCVGKGPRFHKQIINSSSSTQEIKRLEFLSLHVLEKKTLTFLSPSDGFWNSSLQETCQKLSTELQRARRLHWTKSILCNRTAQPLSRCLTRTEFLLIHPPLSPSPSTFLLCYFTVFSREVILKEKKLNFLEVTLYSFRGWQHTKVWSFEHIK